MALAIATVTESLGAVRSLGQRVLRLGARIWIRLLAFNVLLVFLPAAGLLYLSSYEEQLLEGQESAMVQEGRMLAAALSELGVAGLESEDPAAEGGLLRLEAQRIMAQLNRRSASRLRILNQRGELLADSAQYGPRREPGESRSKILLEPEGRTSWLYRLGTGLYHLADTVLARPQPPPVTPEDDSDVHWLERPEIRSALEGQYGAASRPTPGQRSLTLHSALPIHDGPEVVGVVLVSRSTYRILQDLYDMRLEIFQVILASVLAAVILSLLVATTIVRPLRRLQRQSNALIDRRGRLQGAFSGSRRPDEIGDLARALEQLSHRLAEHIGFIEAFAADVSHAFKNPLASIRVAAETLEDVEDDASRRRFEEMIQHQVARMERLLTAARDLTHLDAQLEQEERTPVPLGPLVHELCEGYRLRGEERDVRFDLHLPQSPVVVQATEERLAQVLENLLDNALGFSPEGGTVTVTLSTEGESVLLEIADQGPGIPEAHLEKIFTRFFSYRPPEAAGTPDRWGHTGLGLAVVHAIVEAYGGTVSATNRPSPDGATGAVMRVRLPRADDGGS
jgi:two-component system sensor histidine kinase ChvG